MQGEESGPRVPSWIETQAAPMFGMIAGSENGLTRSGPRSISVFLGESAVIPAELALGRDRVARIAVAQLGGAERSRHASSVAPGDQAP